MASSLLASLLILSALLSGQHFGGSSGSNVRLPSAALVPTFGCGGVVLTSGTSLNRAQAQSSALQTNGDVIVAGSDKVGYDTEEFALARFLPEGSLDPSFGSGGMVLTPVGTFREGIRKVVVQPDGAIVAIGWTMNEAKTEFVAIARYLPDGELDTTFGDGGIETGPPLETADVVVGGGLEPDGDILALVSRESGSIAVYGFTSDGEPDASFGSLGVVTTTGGMAV